MKKFLATALIATFALGAANANANWFWQNDNNDNANVKTQSRVERPVSYKATTPEQDKWIYSGNNSYRSIAGQVAVQDNMNDGDDAAFTVHPTRANINQFNASLRQGDTGQSDATRINQTFNN